MGIFYLVLFVGQILVLIDSILIEPKLIWRTGFMSFYFLFFLLKSYLMSCSVRIDLFDGL